MKHLRFIALALTLGYVFCANRAYAIDSLDDLYGSVRSARARTEMENEAREKTFLARRDAQARRLADAQRRRDRAKLQSQRLSTEFDSNQLKLIELRNRLKQRSGNLGEILGVVRQVAGDGLPIMSESLISAQFPGRAAFFSAMARSTELPSTDELERLWFEIQREMTESGRVVRFRTQIITADGRSADAEAVRIGGFSAIAGSHYLVYLPSAGRLSELNRQPGGELAELAQGLAKADSGFVRAPVDPSRGVLIATIARRPSFVERIEKGEAVGYVIIGVGGTGFLLAIIQAIYLSRMRVAVRHQLRSLDMPSIDNPLGRVLVSVKPKGEIIEADPEVLKLRVSEAVSREVPRLERFQPFLRLAVASGPLLGLVGTVIGMIITFKSITAAGSSDPRLMAHGIGQAMIATVLGLGTAVPLLFMNAGLASLSRGILQTLDEQSARLLAEGLEQSAHERASPRRIQALVHARFAPPCEEILDLDER